MFDYKSYFDQYMKEYQLNLILSLNMPVGDETANGTFDIASKTVFINAEQLKEAPDYEKAFYLFHELRHALQYLCPELFSHTVIHSLQYVIMYDGICYKSINGKYRKCQLEGDEDFLINLYLGQPYEVDANTYAYEKVKRIYGESEDLRELYGFWTPSQPLSDVLYHSVYNTIDEKIE